MYRWFSVAVVALAVLATAFWAFGRGGGGGAGALTHAVVEEHLGVTVVRLSGPPRAKGRALGDALGARIRAELERVLPEDPGLRDFVLEEAGERLRRFLPAAHREEIEGIAEGAGISFDEALFLNTRFELSAHGLVKGEGELPEEGAVGPGPAAACLFRPGAESQLVVVVHADMDPPLWLVTRPGMAGGFLGIRGNVAAAMRPIAATTPPALSGLVWTLALRRLLEERGSAPRVTGPLSVALALPDGSAATLNLASFGATLYAAGGARSLTTDEPVLERGQGTRDPAERERVLAGALRLLGGPPPDGRSFLGLLAGHEGVLLAIRTEALSRDARLEAR